MSKFYSPIADVTSVKEYKPIIDAIINKNEWQTKIEDVKVYSEWKNDFKKQGCDENQVKMVLKCLRKMKETFLENFESDRNKDEVYGYFRYHCWYQFPYFDITEIDADFVSHYNNVRKRNNKNKSTENTYKIIVENEMLELNKLFTILSNDSSKELIIKDLKTNEEKVLFELKQIEKKVETKEEDEDKLVYLDLMDKYVYQSKDLIDVELKTKLNDLINKCPEKDYHPWSNNQVINFFHPSLYPYIHGLTKVIKCLPRKPKAHLRFDDMSDKLLNFQWLATDVKVNYLEDGEITVDFLSEINNLPFSELYDPIGKILAKMMPQFNKLYFDMVKEGFLNYKTYWDYPKNKKQREKVLSSRPNEIKLEKCQFIIKAQEIVLNEGETHSMGSLHLEGTDSECIVATGIYYFNSENINPTKLHFRVQIEEDSPTQEYVEHFLDEDQEIEKFHEIDSVSTDEDLCIVFPNFFFHQVGNVKLKDTSKGGKRKILVFWLVNPMEKIYSTANVLPLQEKMSYEEACVYREMLMFERKYVKVTDVNYDAKVYNKYVEEREYSLCEH